MAIATNSSDNVVMADTFEKRTMTVKQFDDDGKLVAEHEEEAIVINGPADLEKLFAMVEAGRDPFAEEKAFEDQHSDGAFFEPKERKY